MNLKQAELDRLWGGRLESIWFDHLTRRVEMVVATEPRDEVKRFSLVATGVTVFSSQMSAENRPWFHAELTEVRVRRTGVDGYELELLLWTEDNVIKVESRALALCEIE